MKKVFGNNLKKVRRQLGWKSSLVAAKHLGINRPAYQAYEEGRTLPTAAGLVQMAEAMGITNLIAFLTDPNFDYKNQGIWHRREDPIVVKYRSASEKDKRLIHQILEISAE